MYIRPRAYLQSKYEYTWMPLPIQFNFTLAFFTWYYYKSSSYFHFLLSKKTCRFSFLSSSSLFFYFFIYFWEWTDMTNSSGSQVGAFYTLVASLKQRPDKQLLVPFSFLALAHYLSTILITKQNRQIMLKLENFLLKDADILVIHTNQHIKITYHVHKYHK